MDSPIETGRFHFLSPSEREYNGEIAFLMQITPQCVSNIVRDSLERMREYGGEDLTIHLM